MINSVSIIIGTANGLPLRGEGVHLSRVTSEMISNNQSIKGAVSFFPPSISPLANTGSGGATHRSTAIISLLAGSGCGSCPGAASHTC